MYPLYSTHPPLGLAKFPFRFAMVSKREKPSRYSRRLLQIYAGPSSLFQRQFTRSKRNESKHKSCLDSFCLWWPFLLAASARAAHLNIKEKSPNAKRVQTQSGGGGWIRTIEVTDNRFTRPADYKSAALPTELHQHDQRVLYYHIHRYLVNRFFNFFVHQIFFCVDHVCQPYLFSGRLLYR